jgi:hypothetical protein
MAAYPYTDPAPVNFNILATAHLSQGSLSFYDIGTTNPRSTWSDVDLTVLNTNPVNLDSSGRPEDPIFLDGDYTVKLTDGPNGTGATIWTRDLISGADSSFTIPPLVSGSFLTNNGAVLQWEAIELLPDPTGQTGKALVSTGTGYTFQAFPTAPTLDIVVPANYQQVGDGVSTTKMVTQKGTATCGASGSPNATVAVVFPTPFSSVPQVVMTPTGGIQPGGQVVWMLSGPATTTGFTARFDVAEGSGASPNITVAIPFDWIAMGTKVVP